MFEKAFNLDIIYYNLEDDMKLMKDKLPKQTMVNHLRVKHNFLLGFWWAHCSITTIKILRNLNSSSDCIPYAEFYPPITKLSI